MSETKRNGRVNIVHMRITLPLWKCTMCRGPKPFVSEDIYRLHGDKVNTDENISSTVGSAAGPLDNNKSKCAKWPSESCTYLNSSNVCIHCGSPPISANTIHEHIQPLRISQHSDLAQSLSQPRNNSPPASITNIENSRRTSQAKWMCPMCTYENWPKAAKCAMCGTNSNYPRSQASSLIMPSPDQNIEPDVNQDDRYKDYILGVIEGDPNPVEAYLSSGGDPARTLTASEVAILNRSSAFDVGHTLVHLAIRFQREDLLAILLSQIEGSGSGVKRVPSYVAPDIASDIRRHFASTIRQRKGNFPCNFVTEFPTFTLPAEVDELPTPVQDQLFAELLDKDAQEQLESDPAVINWSLDITVRLGSRLYALWNRSAGDCLLDSVMQATWGVFDRDNTLRRTLAESLGQGGHVFYPRWKEYESSHASFLQYSLEEGQWEEDWTSLLSLASQPGTSLEQLHVFALAHILRRPIIVLESNTSRALGVRPLGMRDLRSTNRHLVEEAILRQWLDVCETEGGILVAQQLLHKRPLLVAQMVEEWLNHYRRLS
ncbi:hypothetical protein NQ318_014200 [Aromia moschata]|uniref:ubiquitinyl hydrolase 1 n=1 Tax=Aromia moschata TaxID=1265417 RepID=A0AAV8X626_9CUCU|nr:hypothetical protein NQ318_014200 [Aromia moschata]